MPDLAEILLHAGSTKAAHYGPTYVDLFARLRQSAHAVCEIGVYAGASVRAWHDYFTSATIIGVDVRPKPIGPVLERYAHVEGNITDRAVAAVVGELGPFDVIIDDGSHVPAEQWSALEALLPKLAAGGLYVIEDVRGIELAKSLAHAHQGAVFDLRAVLGRVDDVLVVFRAPKGGASP